MATAKSLDDNQAETGASTAAVTLPARPGPIHSLDREIDEQGLARKTEELRREAASRMKLRTVLSGGGLRPSDFDKMVRGQIIHAGPVNACWRDDFDCSFEAGQVTERDMPLWRRTMEQPRKDEQPFHPLRTPPNELMCPLEQRGSKKVPCTVVQRRLAKENGGDFRDCYRRAEKNPKRPFGFLCSTPHYPCNLFYEEAEAFLRDQFEGQKQAAPKEAPLSSEGNQPEPALVQLRSLVGSGRLDDIDLSNMLYWGVYVLDTRWLPCTHDSQRDQFRNPYVPPAGEEEEDPDKPQPDPFSAAVDCWQVPPGRMRCPLQVQALLGDRAVPCAQAQVLHPAESLVRAAKYALRGTFAVTTPPPVPKDPTWGTPEDPVRRLGQLPCHLLGQVLLHDVKEAVFRIPDDASLLERDRRLLGLEETGPVSDADAACNAGAPRPG